MISLEKWMILTPLQKLPYNVSNLGKIIVAMSFEWLPKVQNIAQSGHTAVKLPKECKGKFLLWIAYETDSRGRTFKHYTIVIFDSRVVLTKIFAYLEYGSRVVNYDCRLFSYNTLGFRTDKQ